MNNEPVAFVTGLNKFDPVMADTVLKVGTPLYTHPAKTPTDDPLVNFKPVWQEKPELTLTDEEIEQVRVAIMGTAYWCADENMPEAYNAIKVCCGQVLGILVKAQEKC